MNHNFRTRAGILIVRAILRVQELALRAMHIVLFGRFARQEKPDRILVFRVAALGDFILSLPALAAIRDQFPSAQIVLLSMATSDRQHRGRVQQYSGPSPLPWTRWAQPDLVDEIIPMANLGLSALIQDLRPRIKAFNPQAAFILSDVSTPAAGIAKKMLLLAALGVRSRVYGLRMRANHRLPRGPQHMAGLFRHHVFGPLQALEDFGSSGPAPEKFRFPLRVAEDDLAWAEQWCSRHEVGRLRLVAVSPGSLQPHKRWPLARYIALIQALLKNESLLLVVVGTAGDRGAASALVRIDASRIIDLCGQTSVGQLAALLRKCALTVGNDGGSMHLSSALGTRTVSIVPGIEYPNSVEPWQDRHRALRYAVPCAPCYSFTHCPLGHARCMTELPLEAVLEQCRLVLDRPRPQE